MIPFRLFNRDKKEMWMVVEKLPAKDQKGRFLCAKEDEDAQKDGVLKIFDEDELLKMRFVDFLEESDDTYE
ncbi:MAG: hypothetical protein KBD78_05405 [Oligoflexales bacterium]|nr:hypothetical protein [Oligoflexales bacterium]